MKQTFLLLIILVSNFSFSQDDTEKTKGLFYKISISSTLKINEDFTLGNDDDETFINPSAFFINNTLGYQFDERTSIGLNIEYDRHTKQGLNFMPTYLSFRYNLFDFDDKLFIRGGYGRLLNISDTFEKGTLYKFGIGYQTFDEDFENSWLIGFDFSRKRFGFRQTEKLSSVSIFLEFQLF
jgi:hypothetical protein